MAIYAKLVSPKAPVFADRETVIATGSLVTRIPIPNTVVLCNGCNRNVYPEPGQEMPDLYMVYLGKRELAQDRPYDCYCGECLRRYFPKAVKV